MAKKICGKTTAYCFYDTEMEGEYYKCYGIKFPVEEKEEILQTITSQSLELFKNEFPKVKIYYEDQIEKQLKSNCFFHETSFKIGDTEIDLTPSKEEMGRSRSSLEYEVTIGYSADKEHPKTEVITLSDINKIKNYSATTGEEFVAKIIIDRGTSNGNSYGKVTEVQFGKNKKADRPYTAAEARQLLLVNCVKKYKNLAKNAEESFLDLVLRNSDYYTSKDCSVRLPEITGDWSKEKLKKEVESCTKNFSSNGNIIIPMVKKYPDSTSHMFVIVANKNGSKTRFKIFDPSIALGLENKENIKQELGDYIYDNLEEEEKNYILSPKEHIQNALVERNPIFDSTCTGVSMEYINYIIDNKQDKNPQQLTEEEGKKIQISYAQNVIGNGLHHMILGEQQIDTSTLYDHILLHDDNERLKLVKYSDYKNDLKKYEAYVVCAINGQEIIITSDKDKFNNDIPGIKGGVYENEAEHYKLDYVEFPVYVSELQHKLLIYANGQTYLYDEYDESLKNTAFVNLTNFNIKLFLDAASNNNLENSGNTQNDRILLYNNERLKLVKYSDYEKKLKNDKEYHVVCTTDGEKFIIPSDQGKFNTNIPDIKKVTDDYENSIYISVNMNNEPFVLLINGNSGEAYLTSEKEGFQGNYRPVYLTGFDIDSLFNAIPNSIPENSSNKSSETVTRSEDMESIIDARPEDIEPIIDARPEDMTLEEVQKARKAYEEALQAQNTLQEKTTTVETKAFQETRQVKQDEVVDKKEVKPEAVSVAVNDTDKKPIQEEITVRNASVETPKEYLIKTELVDDELNIDLIKHKEEEQKKKEEEEQKKKEEEQKKKEEEQEKKETGSIIPALQYVDKAQTNEKSEEESGTFNLLSDMLRNKEKDNKERDNKEKDNKEKDNKERDPSSKQDNQDQGQGTVKDSGLIKRKSRYK